MKIKVSKYKLRKSNSATCIQCLPCAHSQHIESHRGKKIPQAKFPIEFLFSQLHLNNVTSDALFDRGHLVMRSKRCTVHNQ